MFRAAVVSLVVALAAICGAVTAVAQKSSQPSGKTASSLGPEFEPGQVPLGLTWRASVDEVRKAGVQLDAVSDANGEAVFQAKGVPRSLDDARMVLLLFGFDNRLRQIVVIGRDRANDPSGEMLLSRYRELLSGLEQKYGKARSTHKTPPRLAKADFMSSLAAKRSTWSSICDNGRIAVLLSMTAQNATTGNWGLAYDDKALTAAHTKAVKTKTRGAL